MILDGPISTWSEINGPKSTGSEIVTPRLQHLVDLKKDGRSYEILGKGFLQVNHGLNLVQGRRPVDVLDLMVEAVFA